MSEAQRALCGDCGLCCDGTLFESVAVDPAARGRLEPRRLPLVETADGTKLPLPCPCLDGVLCSIYAQRPQRCRSYRCELLRNVEAGRMAIGDARGVIDEVRACRRRTAAIMPPGRAWWTTLARLRNARGELGAAEGLRDDLLELERLVRLRFWQ